MAMGTPYINDTVPVAINGIISEHTPTQLVNRFGAGNVKTPTKNFTVKHNGCVMAFRAGVPVVVDAALLATFTAHNCPVV